MTADILHLPEASHLLFPELALVDIAVRPREDPFAILLVPRELTYRPTDLMRRARS